MKILVKLNIAINNSRCHFEHVHTTDFGIRCKYDCKIGPPHFVHISFLAVGFSMAKCFNKFSIHLFGSDVCGHGFESKSQ